MKQLITLLLALFLASASWSQDAEDPGDNEADATELSETSDPGDPGEEEDDCFGLPWSGHRIEIVHPFGNIAGNYADKSAAGLVPSILPSYDDGYASTAPVGTFPANANCPGPLGLAG